jgi:hyperosmotically inducible periplasmic protein
MKISMNTFSMMLSLGILSLGAVATFTGCAGNQYDRSTGEYIDDKSINARVSSALNSSPEYKFDSVNVTTFKGTVQLSGFVDTSAEKSAAGDIAKQVAGVKEVVNHITIKENSDHSNGIDDKTLTSDVKSALNNNPDYKFDGVNVATYAGVVQLSGFVDTADQKSQAEDIAKQVSGVRDIVNNITVKDNM